MNVRRESVRQCGYSRIATISRIKTKNLEMQRQAEGAEVFGGVCGVNSAVISQADEKVWPTLQPQKTSASSASSAFQGFDFVLVAAPSRWRFKVYGFDFALVAAMSQIPPGALS